MKGLKLIESDTAIPLEDGIAFGHHLLAPHKVMAETHTALAPMKRFRLLCTVGDASYEIDLSNYAMDAGKHYYLFGITHSGYMLVGRDVTWAVRGGYPPFDKGVDWNFIRLAVDWLGFLLIPGIILLIHISMRREKRRRQGAGSSETRVSTDV